MAMHHLETFQALLNLGADYNKGDSLGKTPLLIGVEKGLTDIVKALLKSGADLNKDDNQGKTPLLIGVEKGLTDIVNALLKWGADPNKVDIQGKTPLLIGVAKGLTDIVKALLKSGADPNKDGNQGKTPLLIGVEKDLKDIVNALLKWGADPNKLDSQGKTPLLIGVEKGFTNIVKTLLGKWGRCDCDQGDHQGKTPLMVACTEGHMELVQILLEKGHSSSRHTLDIDKKDNDGNTALALSSSLEVVEALLGAGAEPEIANQNGTTALCRMAGADESRSSNALPDRHIIIGALLAAGADCELVDRDGKNALIYASYDLQDGADLVVAALLTVKLVTTKSGVPFIDRNWANKDGWNPLACASLKGRLDIVNRLLAAGADVGKAGYDGGTPLHYASEKGCLEVVQALLEKGAVKDEADNDGRTPMIRAAAEGCLEVVKKLVDEKADADKLDKDNNTAIIVACQHAKVKTERPCKHFAVVETLLGAKVKLNKAEEAGASSSYWAARNNRDDIMKLLLENGTDKGAALRHAAKTKGDLEVAELIVAKAAAEKDWSALFSADKRNQTAMFLAAENGQLEILKMFMEICKKYKLEKLIHDDQSFDALLFDALHRPRVDDEKRALHVAAENGHADVVELLLQPATASFAENANLAENVGLRKNTSIGLGNQNLCQGMGNHIDKEGQTALHLAVEKGHVECVRALLKDEMVKVDVPRKVDEKTAMHLTVRDTRSPSHAIIFLALKKEGANLKDAVFHQEKCSMEFFDLRGVDLSGVIFDGTVDLEGAMMDKCTNLAGAKMANAIDLTKLKLGHGDGRLMPASQATGIPMPKVKNGEDQAFTMAKRAANALSSLLCITADFVVDADDDEDDDGGEFDDEGTNATDDVEPDEKERNTTDNVNSMLYDERTKEEENVFGLPVNKAWGEDLALTPFLVMLQNDKPIGKNDVLDSVRELVNFLIEAIGIQMEQQKNLIERQVRDMKNAAAESIDGVKAEAEEAKKVARELADTMEGAKASIGAKVVEVRKAEEVAVEARISVDVQTAEVQQAAVELKIGAQIKLDKKTVEAQQAAAKAKITAQTKFNKKMGKTHEKFVRMKNDVRATLLDLDFKQENSTSTNRKPPAISSLLSGRKSSSTKVAPTRTETPIQFDEMIEQVLDTYEIVMILAHNVLEKLSLATNVGRGEAVDQETLMGGENVAQKGVQNAAIEEHLNSRINAIKSKGLDAVEEGKLIIECRRENAMTKHLNSKINAIKNERLGAIEEGKRIIECLREKLQNIQGKGSNLAKERIEDGSDLLDAKLENLQALGKDQLEELQAFAKDELGELRAFAKEVVGNFVAMFKTSIGELKKGLLKAAKKEARRTFSEGYGQMRKHGVFRRLYKVAVELDAYELNRHLREVEQVTELVQGLFEQELKVRGVVRKVRGDQRAALGVVVILVVVAAAKGGGGASVFTGVCLTCLPNATHKVENLDEVSGRWWLLYDVTKSVKCKDVYRILVDNLWVDVGVREAMTISKQFEDCQAPYPSDAVRLFKSGAAKRLRTNYTKIMGKLRKTTSAIEYLKSTKQQAIAVTISGICAIFIGVANFISRTVFTFVSPSFGFSEPANIVDVEVQLIEPFTSRMLTLDVDAQLGEDFYEYEHAHADAEQTDAASKPVVFEVLLQMLQQQQAATTQQETAAAQQQIQLDALIRQQEIQLGAQQAATVQQQIQLDALIQQQQIQQVTLMQQQTQLGALVQHQQAATTHQQTQLGSITQQLGAISEASTLQNMEQWALLASIESAVVPVCLEAAADQVIETEVDLK
jgi:ankyrin repeat protein